MSMLTLINSNGLLDPGSLPSANDAMLFGVKALFIVAGLLYVLFAILISRQISVMSKTIQTTASIKLKFLGIGHLIASIIVLIYFFTVL